MSAYGVFKRKLLSVKYWLCGYSKDEIFIRKILSNYKTDSVKEVGSLISAAFMCPNILQSALKIAFIRLEASENILFSKHIQYYKALLFLQKVCMVSLTAKKEAKKNYLRILSFVFYSKNCCNLDINIRISSTAILKHISKGEESAARSHSTFITCISHTYVESDVEE